MKKKSKEIINKLPEKYLCFGKWWEYHDNDNIEHCNKRCSDDMQHNCRIESYNIEVRGFLRSR